MSTPPEQKNLWKNCTWKNNDEKLAFFNHYFKSSSMVTDRINSEVKRVRDDLIDFIKVGKIGPKENERNITIRDILQRIN